MSCGQDTIDTDQEEWDIQRNRTDKRLFRKRKAEEAEIFDIVQSLQETASENQRYEIHSIRSKHQSGLSSSGDVDWEDSTPELTTGN